ncbi:hypothetical protein AgCh_004157 [Apium graveolens]
MSSPELRSKQHFESKTHFQWAYKTQFKTSQMIQHNIYPNTNSTALMSPLFLLTVVALLSITIAQDQSRSPHGLTHSSPVAFSPSAFEFFHPENHQHPTIENPCAASGCPPLHLSATVQSSLAYDSRFTPDHYIHGRRITAAGIAGIIFGFVFVAILAMGIYYIMTKRQANMSKSNTVQAEA